MREEEREARQAICLQCPSKCFRRSRCYSKRLDVMEIGCEQFHRGRLMSIAACCPEGHWVAWTPYTGILVERSIICHSCRACPYPFPTDECPQDKFFARWVDPLDEIETPQSDLLMITVAIGDAFGRLLDVVRPQHEKFAKRWGADYVALTNPTQNWWGLEKFRVHRFAKRYKRTLFLDADAILFSRTPNLFELTYPADRCVAMHPDGPRIAYGTAGLLTELRNMAHAQHLVYDPDKFRCYNTGVVVTDFPEIWTPPPKPFFPTHCSEQVWIELTAQRLGLPVYDLPIELNNQWWMEGFYERMPASQILHFANCPAESRITWAKEVQAW